MAFVFVAMAYIGIIFQAKRRSAELSHKASVQSRIGDKKAKSEHNYILVFSSNN